MDADGLPLVGAGIDFSKVGAIHQKRTLAFLNHFISHTARFLNRFSCVCEEKLQVLTIRLQRLDTTMNILEAKLSSIPGLESVTVQSASTSTPSAAPTAAQTSAPATTDNAPQLVSNTPTQPAPDAAPEPAEEIPANTITVSQDPRFAQYFKMLLEILVKGIHLFQYPEG